MKKYGAGRSGCALVTGASEGIGFEMARELALRGMNIIIVSRSKDSLEKARGLILETNNKISVDYIVADCSKIDEAVQKIELGIRDKNVTMLINNVGVESG
jgi:17beta-estradiol 17-dehydrogenase / very-long-chain 3-oxoacyl-CoA reductase